MTIAIANRITATIASGEGRSGKERDSPNRIWVGLGGERYWIGGGGCDTCPGGWDGGDGGGPPPAGGPPRARRPTATGSPGPWPASASRSLVPPAGCRPAAAAEARAR